MENLTQLDPLWDWIAGKGIAIIITAFIVMAIFLYLFPYKPSPPKEEEKEED